MAQQRGDPKPAQALLALAMEAVAAGDAVAALDLLQRAHAADPGSPFAWGSG